MMSQWTFSSKNSKNQSMAAATGAPKAPPKVKAKAKAVGLVGFLSSGDPWDFSKTERYVRICEMTFFLCLGVFLSYLIFFLILKIIFPVEMIPYSRCLRMLVIIPASPVWTFGRLDACNCNCKP